MSHAFYNYDPLKEHEDLMNFTYEELLDKAYQSFIKMYNTTDYTRFLKNEILVLTSRNDKLIKKGADRESWDNDFVLYMEEYIPFLKKRLDVVLKDGKKEPVLFGKYLFIDDMDKYVCHSNGCHIGKNGCFLDGKFLNKESREINPETSTGSFFQNIQLLFSKYDNDQRRDKVIAGMRQRLLNGHWLGTAPLGYKNIRDKNNIPTLDIDEKAQFIKKAFLWKANQELSNMEILDKLKKLGFRIYKQRLTDMFKNPVYCGLISHSLLEGKLVEGKFPPIISKKVFLKVNNIQSKNPQHFKWNKNNDNLPLKGFVHCFQCNQPFTGYLVKKKGLYYYKCRTTGCCCNKSAKALHQQFEQFIERYQISSKVIPALKQQLQYTFEHLGKSHKDEKVQLKYSLKTVQEKLDKIEEKYVLDEIGKEQYLKFAKKFRNEKMEIQQELDKTDFGSSNLEFYIEKSLHFASNINETWTSGNYHQKQKIQYILFPDGISYDREIDQVRTERVNSVLELISLLSMYCGDKKSGQKTNLANLSARVTPAGFKPATLRAEI